MSSQRVRVLFFCEAVTLAHVARPAVLCRALDTSQYDVHMAQHPRYRALQGELPVVNHDLDSVTPEAFLQALAKGDPLYSEETLHRYVEEDRALIRSIKPDVVVGDFRISLQVSARLENVPFVTITNAYWSEYVEQSYVVPDLPFTRLLGPRLGQGVFSVVRPLAFALHCRPMNAVRRHYGLPSAGTSLQRVYTESDMTLYADAAELFSMSPLPDAHRFLGPIVWSPGASNPPWWNDAGDEQPRIYVTLGSSGAASLLPQLVAVLGDLPVTALVSTAGAPVPTDLPSNVYVAPYLNGEAAVEGAQLVICNGGSPTTQQALSQGVPVIGLASNLDQHLNMAMLERAGAGRCLRAQGLSVKRLRETIVDMLDAEATTERAGELAGIFSRYDAGAVFNAAIEAVLQRESGSVVAAREGS